jgi:uncharacterized protein (TIGR03083 family)
LYTVQEFGGAIVNVRVAQVKGSKAELIRDEQAEFVELLRSLPSASWSRPSLCTGWSVREVVLHTAAHIHNQQRDKTIVEEYSKRSEAELIEWLESAPFESKSPSARIRRLSSEVQRGELMIHQQDVRRALEMPRTIPTGRITAVLEFGLRRLGGLSLAYGRQRSNGLRLVSSESDWAWGSGPEVRGKLEAILMATSGRRPALDDLDGAGVATLAERIENPSFLVRKSLDISSSATARVPEPG